jgi:hypothetical protein
MSAKHFCDICGAVLKGSWRTLPDRGYKDLCESCYQDIKPKAKEGADTGRRGA